MAVSGAEVLRQLQRQALASRQTDAPVTTGELVTRHALESFLDRLQRTPHGKNFVLKGGILLAGYSVRRPTKDIDSEAISAPVTAAHIEQVVRDVAGVQADDGLVLDSSRLVVQTVREAAAYPGLRMRVHGTVGTARLVVAWDISMGDPIVPLPKIVSIPRVLGEPIEMLGYAPETSVAEKGVTILERGITSTRWRDYVDIVQLAERGIDRDLLLESARAVARYRQVTLSPVADSVVGYGAASQAKWAAWRRKEGLEAVCEPNLDNQMLEVIGVLDPVFSSGPE
jgi:Nucleotidyl transferase AbiEii toxin, Type IV TA system